MAWPCRLHNWGAERRLSHPWVWIGLFEGVQGKWQLCITKDVGGEKWTITHGQLWQVRAIDQL